MSEQAVSEKRKFTRVNVTSLVVIRCDVWASDKREFHTHTENVSEGGLNIILDDELAKSQELGLKLYLTGKVAPIDCKGKVAWTKLVSPPGVKPGLYSTGIQFTELSGDAKESIKGLVSLFCEKSDP